MYNTRVAVALSGGVDSATTAYMLKNQGYDVFGLTMKLFSNQDLEDAKLVAKKLEIEHFIVDFSDRFETEVVDRFIDIYLSGKTPNPCILCNIDIKYGKLLEEAMNLGASHMALGHYAKIKHDEKKHIYRLFKSEIERKDQSYYLFHLTQEKLKHVLLPLEDFTSKDDVRNKILELMPLISCKKDSTDLCFTEGKSLFNYIKTRRNIVNCSGNFIDTDDNYLGKHKGIFNYTIGQKRGLGIDSQKTYYVHNIDAINNNIILTDNENDIFKSEIEIANLNYIDKDYNVIDKFDASVKLCNWGYFIPCEIINVNENKAKIIFNKPERAPASGQYAVFYKDDEVVGGGVIL